MVGGVGAFESNRHAITSDTDDTYGARNPGQAWGGRFDGRFKTGFGAAVDTPKQLE